MTTIERLPFTAVGGRSDELPILARIDPIESSGSLLLLDAKHPLDPWAAGTPAHDTLMPNLFKDNALDLMGSSVDAHAQMKANVPATFTGTAGRFERTGKGGLHAISPQSGASIAQSGPALMYSPQFIEHILDNPSHALYLSAWWRPTRLSTFASSGAFGLGMAGQQTNGGLQIIQPSTGPAQVRPTSAITGRGLVTHPEAIGAAALVPSFTAVSWPGYSDYDNGGTNVWRTYPAAIPPDNAGYNSAIGSALGGGVMFGSTAQVDTARTSGLYSVGLTNAAGQSANKDHPGSFIFYRMYMEDLTVSGRSFAEVSTIDRALYTKEVETVGGRYYGDTFTNPATLP